MYFYQLSGPAVGSFLFTVGGFGLPFYIIGGMTTAVAFALLILIPKVKEVKKKGGGSVESDNDDEKLSLSLKAVFTVSL